MKLYYMNGACSMASRIALHEVGGTFEAARVDKATKQNEGGEDFLAINPLGYVPALRLDDGNILTENTAILAYIADLHPGELAGTSPLDKARFNEALSFLSSELHKAYGPLFARPEGEARDTAIAKLGTRIDHVERLLGDDREFLVGSTFTAADAYAYVILNWSYLLGLSLAKWPKTEAYVARILKRPSVQRALEEEGLIKVAA